MATSNWHYGGLIIIYAYEISWFLNALHSFRYRKDSSSDDEPGQYAIWSARAAGFVMLVTQLVVPFLL